MINSIKRLSSVFLAKLIGTSQKTSWKASRVVRAIRTSQANTMSCLAVIVEQEKNILASSPDIKNMGRETITPHLA